MVFSLYIGVRGAAESTNKGVCIIFSSYLLTWSQLQVINYSLEVNL
jgi:hypothetical protein